MNDVIASPEPRCAATEAKNGHAELKGDQSKDRSRVIPSVVEGSVWEGGTKIAARDVSLKAA